MYNIKSIDNIPELILHGETDEQMADHVVRGLKYYEGENTKRVRMRLLSMGGYVSSGMAILSAMQNFIAKGGEIETVNEGMCYSTMGWIYSMGTTRLSWDYATLFVHDAHNDSGVIDDNLVKVNDSIVLLLSKSTGISEDEMREEMRNTTTYSAEESKSKGFTDEVLISDRKPATAENSTREEIYNSLNKFHKEQKTMTKVAEALNLAPEASADAQVKVIKANIEKIEVLNQAVEGYKENEAKKDETITGLEAKVKVFESKEIENFAQGLVTNGLIKEDKKEAILNMIEEKGFENVKAVYESFEGTGIKKAANISTEANPTPGLSKDQKLALEYDRIKDDQEALNQASEKKILDSMEIAYAEHSDFVVEHNNKKK